MTHDQIRKELGLLFQKERENTNKILSVINEAEDQKTYLVFGYSKLFKWLVQEFKLSNGAAGRRIQAARMLRSVPDLEEKLAEGAVNLTLLCQAQSAFTAQEKATGEKVSPEVKAQTIEQLENKTSEEAEQVLFEAFPDAALEPTTPRNRKLNNNTTRCSYDFTDEDLADIKRLKEVLSHSCNPYEEIESIRYAIKFVLKKKDPLKNPAPVSGRVKNSKAQQQRDTHQQAEGSCQYISLDGHVCGERVHAQVDHIIPRAKGGPDTPENSRLLCQAHNMLMAEQEFGKQHMDPFRRPENIH